ncbi:hypothetical protein BU23DRAFT_264079 [Bimuria novae-zelandiae CBS 107.79]|uniref:Uncharacterized protein n=1 Tax=Bimuria novae-zelandiae CBS 107.79 TaxID=1447943 RepID=A0A6A5UU47_9PLEO|nr:hypothetical protein BU23DRAFT_264079 [Bimuria novae-zelandiae CBS 107.79]
MEQFAPHPNSRFEGFYSKFDLPSGAHIALVICTVPNATQLPPHMVSFTYYPRSGSPIFQREHWVSNISRTTTGPDHAFELKTELGSMRVAADSSTKYDLSTPDWSLQATTLSRTSWYPGLGTKETPEGLLVHLPLPLHWHVHTLSSPTSFTLAIPSLSLPEQDTSGTAHVHQEKKWASSFPAAHVWVQARNNTGHTGICLAGGKILGMHAFLLGYRSPSLNLDFLPPFALALPFGIAPFMSCTVDYHARMFTLCISNFFYKLEVKALAPREGGWFDLGSPFSEGHRRNFCTESFLAGVDIVVWERRRWWSWTWTEIRRERFEGASVEFAGEYFPGRGKKGE